MRNTASSVEEYLAGLPEDRRAAISAVRKVILDHLPEGYEEATQYGMIGYVVPHRIFPAGYHCDPKQPLSFAALGAQKNHMAIHLMFVYGDDERQAWLRKEYEKRGKKLDMGKACLRFKKLDDLALDVIGELISSISVSDYLARYESALLGRSAGKRKS